MGINAVPIVSVVPNAGESKSLWSVEMEESSSTRSAMTGTKKMGTVAVVVARSKNQNAREGLTSLGQPLGVSARKPSFLQITTATVPSPKPSSAADARIPLALVEMASWKPLFWKIVMMATPRGEMDAAASALWKMDTPANRRKVSQSAFKQFAGMESRREMKSVMTAIFFQEMDAVPTAK